MRSGDDTSQHVAAMLLLAAIAMALAPALAVALTVVRALRRRRLAASWLLAPALLATLALTVLLLRGRPTHLAGVVPYWIAATPLLSYALAIWRDRRDRLHGGAAELLVRDAIGPRELLLMHRERRHETAAGPHSPRGILLGLDHRGGVVRLPHLRAHATIVGGSNTGKTNTAEVILEGHALGGGGFVVLDGKGGRDLPRAAVALGARLGRAVSLWSMRPYHDPELDRHRVPWNPLSDGDPTEVKDRIATSEEQTEPYYAAIAARGLLIAARALQSAGDPLDLRTLATALQDPARLAAPPHDAAWLKSLGEGEKSALRGMATRLWTMAGSDGAEALLPVYGGPELRLHEAIVRNHLVVLTLPQGLYPELVPHVTRYALQAINAVCTRIEGSGEPADTIVFVDELSAFDGDQLCAGFERGRSAGVRYVVATQSLSNLATAGGDKLLHAALDNAEWVVVHRQAVPDSAELLASIGGTEEAWEHTHLVADQSGVRIGWDEPGTRNRRLTDRFRAHPNVIKSLGQGEAVLISQRPRFSVRRVAMRPGLSAEAELSVSSRACGEHAHRVAGR